MQKQRIAFSLALVFALVATMAPVPELLAQPSATPITETPTEVPATPEPTSAPTESVITPSPEIPAGTPPGVSATPGVEASSVSNEPFQDSSGSLWNCVQSSSVITPGGSVTVRCNFTISVNVVDNAHGRVTRPNLGNDYQASIDMEYGGRSAALGMGSEQGSASLTMGTTGLGGSRTAAVTILVRAPITASTGSEFSTTFTACRVGNIFGNCYFFDPQHGSITIDLEVGELELEENTHYTAGCSVPEDQSNSAGFAGEVVIRCSVTATENIGDNRFLRFNGLVTTLNGTGGWSGQLLTIDEDPVGTVPGLYQREPAVDLNAGNSFSWLIHLTPTSCAAGSAPLSLGVMGNITLVENGVPGTTYTSAEKTVTVNFDPPPPATSHGSIISAPGLVEVPYSLEGEETASTSVKLRYTASGCEPWDGYIQMTSFTTDDENYSGQVPELESASHGDTSQSGNGFTVVTNLDFETIGESQTPILSGSPPGMEVEVEHTVNLVYRIPPNTPVGEYTSTITVTTSDAP